MTVAAGPVSRQPSRREDAVEIIRRLRDAGHVAYLAGGCVRDELLGLTPKDFDVATDATPERVQRVFAKTQAVGAAFGVILVRLGRSIIEVATFRSEGAYSDGRRPDAVKFTTAEFDAQRRDFTINGIFYDPIDNRVIDFVGGQDDLRCRRLRAIGDSHLRFGEDYLRLLRAVRFAARFELTIEPTTRDAMIRFAPRLAQISPERICDELRLMLTPPTRNAAFAMLIEFGLMDVVTRFTRPHGNDDVGRINAGAAASVFVNLTEDASIGFPLALAGLAIDLLRTAGAALPLHSLLSGDATSRCVRGLRKSLRLSNEETETLGAILRVGELLDPSREPRIAELKRFLALDASDAARDLLASLARVDPAVRQRVADLGAKFAGFAKTDFAPPPFLTGDDLVAAGWQPGPRFKRVLDATYDAQLEGKISDKAGAIEFARGLEASS